MLVERTCRTPSRLTVKEHQSGNQLQFSILGLPRLIICVNANKSLNLFGSWCSRSFKFTEHRHGPQRCSHSRIPISRETPAFVKLILKNVKLKRKSRIKNSNKKSSWLVSFFLLPPFYNLSTRGISQIYCTGVLCQIPNRSQMNIEINPFL